MFKKCLMLMGFLFTCAAVSHAGYLEPDLVYEVGISSAYPNTITVSSSVATLMDTPSMQDRVTTEIQNVDTSVNLWCTLGNGLTATVVNAGHKITPDNFWVVSMRDQINADNQSGTTRRQPIHFYCTSDASGATSKGFVLQIK